MVIQTNERQKPPKVHGISRDVAVRDGRYRSKISEGLYSRTKEGVEHIEPKVN